MNEWLYVGLFFIVGLIIPVGAIGVAWILGPKKPNPIKQSTYECGIEPVGEGWVQFKAQYYIFALVFLVFDVETVFLFPWAVKLGQLETGLFVAVEGIVFVLILIAGLVYAWRKGMLEWV
jgi:NADH:ubiquinone oxidoreductase subunit 3 (subunit A)